MPEAPAAEEAGCSARCAAACRQDMHVAPWEPRRKRIDLCEPYLSPEAACP